MENQKTGEQTPIDATTFARLVQAGYPEREQPAAPESGEPRGPRVVVVPDPVYQAEVARIQDALAARARGRKANRKPRGKR